MLCHRHSTFSLYPAQQLRRDVPDLRPLEKGGGHPQLLSQLQLLAEGPGVVEKDKAGRAVLRIGKIFRAEVPGEEYGRLALPQQGVDFQITNENGKQIKAYTMLTSNTVNCYEVPNENGTTADRVFNHARLQYTSKLYVDIYPVEEEGDKK